MPVLTTVQEYAAIREAIQAFASGKSIYSFNDNGFSVTYNSTQKEWLQDREEVLAKRLSQKNVRKRTFPDFS
jgi:hypothetical protein